MVMNRFNARRCARFNAVGVMGFAVQLGCLWTLTHLLRIHYAFATPIAVELTILHNFAWHARWTWMDRSGALSSTLSRFTRFNLTNGIISIVANTVITLALV